MKPRLHIHSDCAFFAGCENMIAVLFNTPSLLSSYDVSFSYRSSRAYDAGLRQRCPAHGVTYVPLKLWELSAVGEGLSAPLRAALRRLLTVLLVRHVFLVFNAITMYRLFRRRPCDVLHVNNGGYPGAGSCASAVIAARLAGIRRIVYVVNNIAVPYDRLSRILDVPLDRFVARSVAWFITGSRYAGRQLQKVLRIPDRRLAHIPNGIAPRTLTRQRAQVLDDLGIAREKKLFAVVAVLEERKGHRVLLAALRLLLQNVGQRGMPITVIEGSGPLESALRACVANNGLDDFVRFVPNMPQVFDLLHAADAVILPSISHEDFPNVVLEAMSLARPVIASRIAGTVEQIEAGKTGLLVEPGDSAGLADAMAYILNDPGAAARMGAAAAERFRKEFTADHAAARYLELYHSILTGEQA